jgi:hypothetical protein
MDNYTSTALAVNPPSLRRISAQSIAKCHWQPQEKARRAADWVAGITHVKPTVALASRVYRVSEPLIREALKRQRHHHNGNGTSAPTALVRLNQAWARATPVERAEFGRAIGVNVVWDDAVAPNLT